MSMGFYTQQPAYSMCTETHVYSVYGVGVGGMGSHLLIHFFLPPLAFRLLSAHPLRIIATIKCFRKVATHIA